MVTNYSHLTDEELAVIATEPDAFAELESRYLWLVNFVARKFKIHYSLEDDDLRQEGLLGLYNAACTFKPDQGVLFKTYASLCISNRLKNELRNHSSKKNQPLNESVSLNEMYVESLGSEISPEQLIENNESFEAVLNQIHISLSDFEKKILVLYLSGYKRSEISEKMGISLKAFDNALQRVRKKLKAK